MDLGIRLKKMRKRQGLTLKQVSNISGLSTGLLSLIERGQANPSLSSMSRFSAALGSSLGELFNSEENESRRTEDVTTENVTKDLCEIVRKGTHKMLIVPGSYIQYHILNSNVMKNIEMLLEITPPGKGALDDKYVNTADSLIYILEGSFKVEFDETVVFVNEGDSIFFPKGISYKYLNVSENDAKSIVVNIPPTF